MSNIQHMRECLGSFPTFRLPESIGFCYRVFYHRAPDDYDILLISRFLWMGSNENQVANCPGSPWAS